MNNFLNSAAVLGLIPQFNQIHLAAALWAGAPGAACAVGQLAVMTKVQFFAADDRGVHGFHLIMIEGVTMLQRKSRPSSLVLWGFTSGIIAGLVSSEIFIIGVLIFNCIQDGCTLLEVGGVFLLGQFFGPYPAILIGLVCGSAMGLFFRLIRNSMSVRQGAALGVLFSLTFATLFIGAFDLVQFVLGPNRPRLFGIKFLAEGYGYLLPIFFLYLCSGAWTGMELARCKESHLLENTLDSSQA